jgi:hypothetical protein
MTQYTWVIVVVLAAFIIDRANVQVSAHAFVPADDDGQKLMYDAVRTNALLNVLIEHR